MQVGIPYVASVHDERVARFGGLLDDGLLAEVRALRKEPGGLSRTARQAIGLSRVARSHRTRGSLRRAQFRPPCNVPAVLARRQWSWFKRDPRIVWLDPSGDLLGQLLERWDAAAHSGPATGARRAISSPVGD